MSFLKHIPGTRGVDTPPPHPRRLGVGVLGLHEGRTLLLALEDESNFYLLSISSDGYYSIFKMINNEWLIVGSPDWGFNDHVIRTGIQPNHLRASCIGNNLVLEVNDSVLMDVYDSDLSSGDVGLYAGTYDAGGLEVEFA